MNPGEVTQESSIYRVVQKTLRKEGDEVVPWNIEENGVISGPEDFDLFPWEEAAKLDFSKFYEIQPFLPAGMKILACSGKVFTVTWMLLGFQNFCLSLYLQEELVSRVFRRVGEIQVQGAKELLKIPNIGALWVVDDLSYGSGPMIDPKFFRKYVFPWYEELAALAKKQGLLFFFHSDGNIWPIMDDLIAIGFDAIHPIDPTSMDIREVKDKGGQKIGDPGKYSHRPAGQGNARRGSGADQEDDPGCRPGRRVCPEFREFRPQLGPLRKLPGHAGDGFDLWNISDKNVEEIN